MPVLPSQPTHLVTSSIPSRPHPQNCKRLSDHALDIELGPQTGDLFVRIPPPESPYLRRKQALDNLLWRDNPAGLLQKPWVRRLGQYALENCGQLALGALTVSLLEKSSPQAAAGDFLRNHLVSTIATGLYQEVVSAFRAPAMDGSHRLRHIHQQLVIGGQQAAKKLPQELQHRLRRLDYRIEEILRAPFNVLGSESVALLMARREGMLLSFPQDVLTLFRPLTASVSSLDESRFRQINTNVTHLLNEFRHVPELGETIRAIRLHSLMENPSNRVQVFIYGPGGVGKTHFVRRLSEALGLPLHETSLRHHGANDIFGTSGALKKSAHGYLESEYEDFVISGLVPFASTVTGYQNCLLFCNEADDLLNLRPGAWSDHGYVDPKKVAHMKYFFSPENSKVVTSLLVRNLAYDFRHMNIVLEGQRPPLDPSLSQLFKVVHFPDLPRERKLSVATQTMHEAIAALPRADRETQQSLADETQQYVEGILNVDEELGIKGVRRIQAAVRHLVEAIFQGRFPEGPRRKIAICQHIECWHNGSL